jgi:molecular chaperone HscB
VLDQSRNHFQLFGLPETFAQNPEVLAERYHALRQRVHPDLFATAGERERRLSLQASTLVNEAYQTLKDPLARARYLLLLKTGTEGDDQETTQDMAFLMEQMELREALADARAASDPFSAIDRVRGRLSRLGEDIVAALALRLDRDRGQTGDEEGRGFDPTPGSEAWSGLGAAEAAELRELIRKLQFVRKCEAEAEALEAELEDAL